MCTGPPGLDYDHLLSVSLTTTRSSSFPARVTIVVPPCAARLADDMRAVGILAAPKRLDRGARALMARWHWRHSPTSDHAGRRVDACRIAAAGWLDRQRLVLRLRSRPPPNPLRRTPTLMSHGPCRRHRTHHGPGGS